MNSTLREDTTIWPALQRLADCLCAQLEAAGGPELCFCGVQGGDTILADYPLVGGCGGMGFVRLVTAYPSMQQFPSQDAIATCATVLGFQVEVGVLRPGPMLDDEMNPPDSAAWNEAVQIQLSDMAAVRRAVACCFAGEDTRYLMDAWLPTYQGDILGGSWMLTIQQEF